MTKKKTYESGRQSMAAEILLILAAGAGTSGIAHVVHSVVRSVWDPDNYPYTPLPRGIANKVIDYENALLAAKESPAETEDRHGYGSRGIIVPSDPNAAVEGADSVDESLGDA